MIRIARFRPLRYSPESISFISRVVAPPFDIVDRDMARDLREQDPHNCIRLTLGKQGRVKRASREYTRAAETLESWRQGGILVRESAPSLYLCQQRFRLCGRDYERHGLLAAVLLPNGPSDDILPHEQTMPADKADRLRLMEATCASLSPVFGVFTDPSGVVHGALADMKQQGSLLYEFQTPDGVAYRLWQVTDGEYMRALAGLLQDQDLVIADGHHRYETACAYRREHRSSDGPPGSAPEDFLLVFAVSSHDSGLLILPTHRLLNVEGPLDLEGFVSRLESNFSLTEQQVRTPEELQTVTGSWQPGEKAMGCYLAGGRLLVLRPPGPSWPQTNIPAGPPEWRELVVVALHYGILRPFFDIPPEAGSEHPALTYEADLEEVYWQMESGQFDLSFLLPPQDPKVLERIARAGRVMPPKSTYFYPKILSGLLFYPFAADDGIPEIVKP